MVLGKHEIEAALHAEKQEINAGRLKEDSPLDVSEEFRQLCDACRRGDLKACQEKIQEGVRINARDRFDYTPLNLASLCGHYEVVRLLLESGALCERDTFEGERCLYNALNDRIRNLLLSYDYSKSRDPLQPFAGHVTSLLNRNIPETSDIIIKTDTTNFHLHKFVLSARSPYFAKKLTAAPQTTSWKVSSIIPAKSLEIVIVALYFGEVNYDFSASEEDQEVLRGVEKISNQLEVGHVFDTVLENDRRIARQRRTEEVQRGRDQLDTWFRKYVLGNCVEIESEKADAVLWDRENSMFADVLLCAEHDPDDSTPEIEAPGQRLQSEDRSNSNGLQLDILPNTRGNIPIGSFEGASRSPSRSRGSNRRSTLFPVHRAMLIRSEYFSAMFSSPFKEAQRSDTLPIVHIDCNPDVLRVILAYLYTEETNFGLEIAVEVLFAADLLLMDKVKNKAAVVISTLGNGTASIVEAGNSRGGIDTEDVIDIFDVIRAGWDTRMQRLEEFGARYIAHRLERYVEDPEFKQLVQESAGRIHARQETDTIELIDDIRYYLDERYRLRFEDLGFGETLETQNSALQQVANGQTRDTEASKVMDDHSKNDLEADVGQALLEPPILKMGPAEEADSAVVRTLDGDEAEDEFAQDALNYQILLGKIDSLLAELNLDA